MQKYKKYIILLISILFLTGCGKEEYKVNEEVTLKGKISTNEITKDNEKYKVTVLNLDEPIIIDGTKINKIELDYDKNLKDDYEVTIVGTIKPNGESNYQLSYAFEVIDIDDVLSYINTFANEDFYFAIPTELIKDIIVKEIDRGYAIYSNDNPSSEIFRIFALSKEEFNKTYRNSYNIEKVISNRDKIVIIKFNDEDTEEINYEITNSIINNISRIKSTVQLK